MVNFKVVIGFVLTLTLLIIGVLILNSTKKENKEPTKIENKPAQTIKPILTPQELVLSKKWSERVEGYKALSKIDIVDNPELIKLVFQCIDIEHDLNCFSYAFWPIQFNGHDEKKYDVFVMNKLFDYLNNDRPEIWYNSAYTIKNTGYNWKERDKYDEKVKLLKGIAKLRLQLAFNFSKEVIAEFKSLGEDPYPFLISNITYNTFEKSNEAFCRACEGLAYYGDKKAVPALILSILELHKYGKTKDWYSPVYVLRAINYILDTNYGEVGKDFGTISGNDVNKINWESVVEQLKADFK